MSFTHFSDNIHSRTQEDKLFTIEYVKINNLRRGDILARTVYDSNMRVLLRENKPLTDRGIQTIKEILEMQDNRAISLWIYYHSLSVCMITIGMGIKLGLERSQLKELGLATIYHDLGRIFFDIKLLYKTELCDEEILLSGKLIGLASAFDHYVNPSPYNTKGISNL